MSLIQDSKTYHLSSMSSNCNILNDDPNYKSLLQFSIPDFIVMDDFIEYMLFSVPYAIVPVTFYNINASNCLLIITFNSNTYYYNFPYGNYDADSFMTQFLTLLGLTFSITLNENSSVFTISNSIYDFTLNGQSTIDYIMGFSDTISSTNKFLTLERCCNFFSLPRIILRCVEINGGQTVGEIQTNNILASIPNNSGGNGQIIYNPNNAPKTLIKSDKINTLTISLTDDLGNLINFNGLSSYFTIQIDTFRKYVEKPESFNKIVQKVNLENIKRDIQDLIDNV